MTKIRIDPSHWSPRLEPRNYEICQLYLSRRFMTKEIAANKGLRPRQVQRILKQGGVLRSRPDALAVAARLRPKRRIR